MASPRLALLASLALLVLAELASAATTPAFKHPGILVDKRTLNYVKQQIQAGAEPWTSAFNLAQSHSYADLTRIPKPRATIECGGYNIPNLGCDDERDDANAAYTLSLMWSYTGNIQYATKAREILDAWANVLVQHNNSNRKLVVAWNAEMFPRAAEIIRHTTPAGFWPATSIARFENMLKRKYIPMIKMGQLNGAGNWELAMADALISMGVFLNDRDVYNLGVKYLKRRVTTYFYLKSDGTKPKPPPEVGTIYKTWDWKTYWHHPSKLVNGLCAETCRDMVHAQLGLMSAINALETVRIQGGSLFKKYATRLAATVEFHAFHFMPANHAKLDALCPQPGPQFWGPSCANPSNIRSCGAYQTFEIAYSNLAQRLRIKMPKTAAFLSAVRPLGISPWNHVIGVWESLTHSRVGRV